MLTPQTAALVAALSFLPALAHADVTVTFWTTPAGATLVDSGRIWGATPVTLRYKTPRRWRTCLTVTTTATWISGAASEAVPLQICPQQGKTQTVELKRPQAPGLELDITYGAQLQQLAVLQQQLAVQREIASDTAAASAWANVNAALALTRQSRPIACRTVPDAMGLTAWTTCR